MPPRIKKVIKPTIATKKSERLRTRTKKAIENDILEAKMSLEACAEDIQTILNNSKDFKELENNELENIRDDLQDSLVEFEENWQKLKIFLEENDESYSDEDQNLYKNLYLVGSKLLKRIIRHLNGELSTGFDERSFYESVSQKDFVSKINAEEKTLALVEAAEAAEKVKALEQKKILESKMRDIEQKKREIELEIELQGIINAKNIAEKRHDILSQAGSDNSFLKYAKSNVSNISKGLKSDKKSHVILHTRTHDVKPGSSQPPPDHSPFFPSGVAAGSTGDTQIASVLAAAVQQLCNQQINQNDKLYEMYEKQTIATTRNSLAKAEPPIFSGDVVSYPAWKSAFVALIDNQPIRDNEKLFLLGKYTGSKTRQMIQTYISLGTSSAYKQALDLLDERYGNPTYIYEAFKDKLNSWPKINKATELQEYYDFIQQLHDSMGSMDNLKMFDHISSIKDMVKKLPIYTFNDWQKVYESTVEKGNPVTLKVFVDFLKKVAKRAVDPIFSREALGAGKESSKKVAYVTEEVKTEKKYFCFHCEKDTHEITHCGILNKKSYSEIIDIFFAKRLCYGCGSKDHIYKDCNNKKTCSKCKEKHLTIMHDKERKYVASKSKEDKATGVSSSTSRVGAPGRNVSSFQPIVSVFVYSADQPGKRVRTYALIDGGSNVCFISKDLFKHMNLKGDPVSLQLNTVHGAKTEETWVVNNLLCKGVNEDTEVKLPSIYVQDELPMSKSSIPCYENVSKLEYLKDIACKIPPYSNLGIGLIIGTNCPKGTFVQEIASGDIDMPQAFKYILGWTVQGPAYNSDIESYLISHRIQTSIVGDTLERRKEFIIPITCKEIFNPYDVACLLDVEYKDCVHQQKSASMEDKQFLEIAERSIHKSDGHFEMALPLREKSSMPDNRGYVFHRFNSIVNKLKKDHTYHEKYTKFMEDMITEGHAELVPNDEISKTNKDQYRVWYIPHFGVVHAKKPDKTRVVFDCAAKFKGVSLNDKLLQGPDLTNSLIGVLLRFRLEPVAFMADIKSMFHQVRVNREDRDFLRFFWNKGGDLNTKPLEYRMCVHLFGAVSSPSCSNYALRKCTDESICPATSDIAKQANLRNMYVDDLIKSVENTETAKSMINDIILICKSGGFELTKFHFNNSELSKSVPLQLQASISENVSLKEHNEKYIERALGVHWSVREDVFGFCITDTKCIPTRRGILSMISSVYDPLGFCSPVILVGKRVLQSICKLSTTRLEWDSPVPAKELKIWDQWKENLIKLNKICVKRCYKPKEFGKIESVQMHHFSDAAPGLGLGQCSYLRLINSKGDIHCSLLMSKSRVPPLKSVTVPRLELNACVQAVRLAHSLNKELDGEFGDIKISNFFWTDSMIALGYIANESTRFKTFVANRVEEIREYTKPSQWHHINSLNNPADICSRGCSVEKLLRSNFFHGPDYLWKEFDICDTQNISKLDQNDIEFKNVFLCGTVEVNNMVTALEKISSWIKIKKVASFILRWRSKEVLSKLKDTIPDVEEMKYAEKKILFMVQQKYFFSGEGSICAKDKFGKLRINDKNLLKLDPFLSDDDLIRVGGRLRNSSLSFDIKHPILLPKQSNITKSLVLYYHSKVYHQGRGLTNNEIRQNGYWIFGGSKFISGIISKCVNCKKLRGKTSTQKMADLPFDRVDEECPCFTYCGCDFFGPFFIKERRSELKRYGCIFTCLVSRAIHIEVAPTLETSSFINSLRRFLCRRGPVRHIRCDQGSNFIGCSNELKMLVGNLDHNKVRKHLLDNNCDWVEFKFNSPSSSHMGGAWERMIRTVRSILNAMLLPNGPLLDNDGLLTFMCEVEAVVNSRPLTEIDNSTVLEPLTPNHLLTGKTKVVLSPPSEFTSSDMYARKKWRHVQYLINQFWSRFRSEYLLLLQKRNKWQKHQRNYKIGDIVLIKEEDAARNTWKLAKVIDIIVDDQGIVRKVKLQCSTSNLDMKGRRITSPSILERPIHKLVLLTEYIE